MILTIHWHWMIPTRSGRVAHLSKLLLMPMSMDGDIVCFTGYLDFSTSFFAHQNHGMSKFPPKTWVNKNWIRSNKVVSSQNLQRKSKLL